MDIATLVGLLGGFGIIIGAIATGGDVMLFVNVPSILIVVGGTFMVTLMQVSLADFLGSFGIGLKAGEIDAVGHDRDALAGFAVAAGGIADRLARLFAAFAGHIFGGSTGGGAQLRIRIEKGCGDCLEAPRPAEPAEQHERQQGGVDRRVIAVGDQAVAGEGDARGITIEVLG